MATLPGCPPHGQGGDPPRHVKDGAGNSPPSSPERGGTDSDGYSMVSKSQSTHHCKKSQGEKWLAPAHLDMPIFKSTDPNTDVTYTLWRFDVQVG